MPGYRIYHVDGADRVSTGDWIEASDDKAALAAAAERRVLVEVWQGSRLVGRLDPAQPKAGD